MILYSKNTFQIVCPKISTYPTNKRIPGLWGTNSLVTVDGPMKIAYMKRVNLTFSCYARDNLENLPTIWSSIEPMVLGCYPSVQNISLNLLRINPPYRVLIVMARKHEDKPRTKSDAYGVQSYLDTPEFRRSDLKMKFLCDTLLPSQRSGLFDDSSFAIRSIQWSNSRKSRKLEKLTSGIFLD